MVKLVNTADLGSAADKAYGFESRSAHPTYRKVVELFLAYVGEARG